MSTTSDNKQNAVDLERKEGSRVVLYVIIGIVTILVVGFIAGLLNNALRPSVGNNVFVENSVEILSVIASTAPWFATALVLCAVWAFVAEQLFVRWNRAFGSGDEKNHGIIYEIVVDNNSAAALVLLIPLLLIILTLMFVALLNLPYNLRDAIQVTPRG